MTQDIARLQIRRAAPGDEPRTERYDFPLEDGESVLDALRWIRGHVDASLAVRYACINANACKECVIRIDGRTGYACTTKLRVGEMLLEPLANKPLVRDLVTETAPPDERLDHD